MYAPGGPRPERLRSLAGGAGYTDRVTTGQGSGSGTGGEPHALGAEDGPRAACRAAVARLRGADVPTEALAEYVAPRKAFLRTRPATMRPIGEVWRLGSLLLDTEGNLYAAGHATRSAERGRPGYQSVSREERREIAAAALRGGYPIGTAVNYDAVPIPIPTPLVAEAGPYDADGPVGISEGALRVRWRPGASLDGAPTLESFLADRVGLLVDPPLGAS